MSTRDDNTESVEPRVDPDREVILARRRAFLAASAAAVVVASGITVACAPCLSIYVPPVETESGSDSGTGTDESGTDETGTDETGTTD
jgi:hypothetical protein